jgi:putative transposase
VNPKMCIICIGTDGVVMQRDLYSAYLARFVENDTLQAARAKLAWQGAEPLLRAAWRDSQQLASGKAVPSSFGVCRSQSESPEKESLVEREALDVVAFGREPGRACQL